MTFAEMWEKINRDELEDLLEIEEVLAFARDKYEINDVFHARPYETTWQSQLDHIRQQIKKAKNDFKINHGKEFIPG